MKSKFLVLSLILCAFAHGQTLFTDSIIALQTPLEESSGLIMMNGRIITLTDSGNPPTLYEIDTTNGTASRTIYVGNATNVDWEDICADSNFIYIGDMGNNQGTRQDLKIYKVAIADYLNTTNDTIWADTISFSYADQTTFNPAPFQTNYDAESLISFGDSLYILTKQWSKPGTTIYSLSKTTGSYSIHKIDSLQMGGVVTAADYNPATGFLAVVSHTNNYATLLVDYGWYPGKLPDPTRQGYMLQVKNSLQVEGAGIDNMGHIYFSSETGILGDGILSKTRYPNIGITEHTTVSLGIFPNPSHGTIHLENAEQVKRVSVVDMQGKTVINATEPPFSTIHIGRTGLFVLRVQLISGAILTQRVAIVR